MGGVARVQARGQVTVPQEIREALGIDPGTELLFVQTAPGRFECQVLPPKQSLVAMVEHFAMGGEAPAVSVLREGVAEDIAREQIDAFSSSGPDEGP